MICGMAAAAAPLLFAGPLATARTLSATPALSMQSASSHHETAALEQLIGNAAERLALADAVARYKWSKQQSITDTAREKVVLAKAEQQAVRYGVEPEFAQAFFRDQIAANKLVQHAWFDQWRTSSPASTDVATDLITHLRPQFDRLTDSMLAHLAQLQGLRVTPGCAAQLGSQLKTITEQRNLDATHALALRRAFRHFCAERVNG
jgi:chorismate mutase